MEAFISGALTGALIAGVPMSSGTAPVVPSQAARGETIFCAGFFFFAV